jgi:hypothetical protein
MEPNRNPSIFKNSYVFGLFQHLVEEYTSINIHFNFLMIYHFLKSEKLLFCSEEEYIKYIQDDSMDGFSSLQDDLLQYTNETESILVRLKNHYDLANTIDEI